MQAMFIARTCKDSRQYKMRAVDELLEQARRLPPQARRELRDRLDASLEAEEHKDAAESPKDGSYASLLRSAGSAHSFAPDIARKKNEHIAQIYAPKRTGR
jgi:hypothetical protein